MKTKLPKIGSRWMHANRNIYRVTALANTRTDRPGQYPVTVVYVNAYNKEVWCRPASDWHRSMTQIADDEQ